MSVSPDLWASWREVTGARIGLGRAGGSLPTREWLEFSLAHGRARDAVHRPLDTELLQQQLTDSDELSVVVTSGAKDRAEMLRRPDLGRQLGPGEAARLQLFLQSIQPEKECDLAVLIGDGLSAPAAQSHAIPVLMELLPQLRAIGWRISPIVIAQQARVALQDEVGALMNAQLALILLGERPGLSSSDSLGAYLVHGPRPGRNDAERNCVSNIRPEGLPVKEAVDTLYYLLTESRHRKLSGFHLKDERILGLTADGGQNASLPAIVGS